METNEKLMTLLRLMDEPEAMTEAQLEELLSDDEVRKTYELMADCKKACQREKLYAATPIPHRGRTVLLGGWVRRIAAAFLGVLFLSGLAFAAWHAFSPAAKPTAEAASQPSTVGQQASTTVRFDDVRLDSILTVVAAHYGKTVSYRDREPRTMKFITTWNPDDPLEAFIDHLNIFDYLRLTLHGDTIVVEHTEGEDAK